MSDFNKYKTGGAIALQVQNRLEMKEKIKELRAEQARVEQNITEFLIEENLTEYFSVNWDRVQKTDW